MATTKVTTTREQTTPTSAAGTEDATALDSDSPGNRPAPTSTFITTTRASELITATPSSGMPSSIQWGPASTASALPTPETNAQSIKYDQPSAGMSHDGRSTLIATTTIGGTFILAFLIYALWRRRKGATYSEIIHFRPHSSTLILSPGPRNPDFTALPIYRESRYSVRSTKRGSWLSFGKLMQIRAPSPSSEAFSKGQWLHAQWKSATPPTPTRAGHPLSHVQNASAPAVSTPEMAHARANSQTERIRIKRAASESNISKPLPTVSAREVAASPDVEDLDAGEPPDTPRSDKQLPDDSCWSWTNSQAPATPRMRTRSLTRRPSGASIRSLSSFHKVHSWLKPQTERAVNQIPEEQAPRPAPKPKLPPLKNKASKPILAPINTKPTRRLSKKSGPPSVASNRSRARSVGR